MATGLGSCRTPAMDETAEPRFVLDGHLGRLASHLRMLGLDCLYDNAYEDEELVHISVEEGRILLTRDRLLLMHKVITHGYLLTQPEPNRATLRSRSALLASEMGQAVRTLHELQPPVGTCPKRIGSGEAGTIDQKILR